jgi:hypothetical protein
LESAAVRITGGSVEFECFGDVFNGLNIHFIAPHLRATPDEQRCAPGKLRND